MNKKNSTTKRQGGPENRVLVPEELGPLLSKVQHLVEGLKDEHPEVRYESVVALGDLHAKGPIGIFIEGLKDADTSVRRACARILGKMGPAAREAIPALTEALTDRDTTVRIQSTRTLERITEATTTVRPDMEADGV